MDILTQFVLIENKTLFYSFTSGSRQTFIEYYYITERIKWDSQESIQCKTYKYQAIITTSYQSQSL